MSRAADKQRIWRYRQGEWSRPFDRLSAEEPLEIRLAAPGQPAINLTVTMRTPGHDFELVAGFLFSEGVVSQSSALETLEYCTSGKDQEYNVISARLASGHQFHPEHWQRSFLTHSGCGVCGKASLDHLEFRCERRPYSERPLTAELLCELPERMRAAQRQFESTGGLHAAACCTWQGEVEVVREDVGRHNAADKVVGRLLLDDLLPADDRILVLSGRASFELMQKAVMAGFPMVVALGAPSTLALGVARRYGVTLLGFTKSNSFNLYCGPERLQHWFETS